MAAMAGVTIVYTLLLGAVQVSDGLVELVCVDWDHNRLTQAYAIDAHAPSCVPSSPK